MDDNKILENGPKSPSEMGVPDDVTHQKALALQEESLVPLQEDLAEWLSKTFEIDITAENFMDVLDNGVYLCDLINVVHRKAEECILEGKCNDEIPKVQLKCKRNAQSGSWFARDNTANFLKQCKAFGMTDDCTFESEDLGISFSVYCMFLQAARLCVVTRSERQVIITLLELARIGCKYGLEPPNIIKIEKEIEKEEEPFEEDTPKIEEPKPLPSARSRPLILDEEVRKMAAKCRCSEHVKRIREGTYMVFGKVMIIRGSNGRTTTISSDELLKNRHLMVRVGGGWETLEHYLIKHNPVLVVEHKRKKSIDFLNGDDVLSDKFLYIKAQYKN